MRRKVRNERERGKKQGTGRAVVLLSSGKAEILGKLNKMALQALALCRWKLLYGQVENQKLLQIKRKED